MLSWQNVVPQADQLGESPFWHPRRATAVLGRHPRPPAAPGRPAHRRAGELADAAGARLHRAGARGGGLVIALRDGMYRARTWGGALDLLYRVRARHGDHALQRRQGRSGSAASGPARCTSRSTRPRRSCSASMRGRAMRSPVRRSSNARPAARPPPTAWPGRRRPTPSTGPTPRPMSSAPGTGTRGPTPCSARACSTSSRRKPAGWLPGQPGYGGRPDGAAVDVEGNYWCAMYEGGRLLQLSPAGAVVRELATPFLCPTMPCFGGEDLRTLYVTSARQPAGRGTGRVAAVRPRGVGARRGAGAAGQFLHRLSRGGIAPPSAGRALRPLTIWRWTQPCHPASRAFAPQPPPARPCASAAAAARTSYGQRLEGELLETARTGRHPQLRAQRAGRHRGRRHAAGGTRGDAGCAGPVPAVRAAALRRRAPPSAAWWPPAWRGRRAPASARCATTCSA